MNIHLQHAMCTYFSVYIIEILVCFFNMYLLSICHKMGIWVGTREMSMKRYDLCLQGMKLGTYQGHSSSVQWTKTGWT